jgi:hypothetical protein
LGHHPALHYDEHCDDRGIDTLSTWCMPLPCSTLLALTGSSMCTCTGNQQGLLNASSAAAANQDHAVCTQTIPAWWSCGLLLVQGGPRLLVRAPVCPVAGWPLVLRGGLNKVHGVAASRSTSKLSMSGCITTGQYHLEHLPATCSTCAIGPSSTAHCPLISPMPAHRAGVLT